MSIRRDGSLHIERVSVQDEGQYTCVAENVAGASNRTTNIHVYGKMGLRVTNTNHLENCMNKKSKSYLVL